MSHGADPRPSSGALALGARRLALPRDPRRGLSPESCSGSLPSVPSPACSDEEQHDEQRAGRRAVLSRGQPRAVLKRPEERARAVLRDNEQVKFSRREDDGDRQDPRQRHRARVKTSAEGEERQKKKKRKVDKKGEKVKSSKRRQAEEEEEVDEAELATERTKRKVKKDKKRLKEGGTADGQVDKPEKKKKRKKEHKDQVEVEKQQMDMEKGQKAVKAPAIDTEVAKAGKKEKKHRREKKEQFDKLASPMKQAALLDDFIAVVQAAGATQAAASTQAAAPSPAAASTPAAVSTPAAGAASSDRPPGTWEGAAPSPFDTAGQAAMRGHSAGSSRERRRRRGHEQRGHSRSRRRRRDTQQLPPDAWQVWPAGSYHPWSSQLAQTSGNQAGVGEAWASSGGTAATAAGKPAAQAGKPADQLEAPRSAPEPGENSAAPTPVPMPAAAPAPSPPDEEQADLEGMEMESACLAEAVQADMAAGDSPTSGSSEEESGETESQDEDAEIGEAPIAPKPVVRDAQAAAAPAVPEQAEPPTISEDTKPAETAAKVPKAASWLPAGLPKRRGVMHRSAVRWPGPAKTSWEDLFLLELDPALSMKLGTNSSSSSSARSKERSSGVNKFADSDASQVEDIYADENPSEAPVESCKQNGTDVEPVAIPHWNCTRTWFGLLQVALDEGVVWQPRQLSSIVLRSRRKGRSAQGGLPGMANPQDPPEGQEEKTEPAGSSLLLSIGGAARRAVRLVKWRAPTPLDLPPEVTVDPAKYTGTERGIRQKRRPAKKAAATKSGGAAAAVKSAPPAKAMAVGVGGSQDYKGKLMALMQHLQAGGEERVAVRNFWASLSAADRVQFSSEFPQFMHLVIEIQLGTNQPGGSGQLALPGPPGTLPGGQQLLALPAGPGAPVPMAGIASAVPGGIPKASASRPPVTEAEAAWAERMTFHNGVLRVNMSSMKLSDADMAKWCQWAPELLKTLSSAAGAPLTNAEIDFSRNAIEDSGLRQLLSLLTSCDVHFSCLNLDGNRLTEMSLVEVSEFLVDSRTAIPEVRMVNNKIQGTFGVMHLARAIRGHVQYPTFWPDMQRYTPFMLHLAGNQIEQPMSVTQLLREALGNKYPCLAEERRFWEAKMECPPLQLPFFEKQGKPVVL